MMNINYSSYFDKDKSEAYKSDIGAFCTRELFKPFAAGEVLEIGCGINRVFEDSDTLDIIGDTTYKCFIEDLDLSVESYDTIIMSHVLEHIKSDFNAIRKCYQILRKGGRLIVLSPFGKSGICSRKEIIRNGHLRRYNRERVALLESPNFPCVYYQQVHFAHSLIWNRLKYVLKALCYPIKLIDKKELYDRRVYKIIFPGLVKLLNYWDKFNINGNALFILEKV